MANVPDSGSSPSTRGTAVGSIADASLIHATSQRLRSTGACQSAFTLSLGRARFRQIGPLGRSTLTISEDTPPASGLNAGTGALCAMSPIRRNAATNSCVVSPPAAVRGISGDGCILMNAPRKVSANTGPRTLAYPDLEAPAAPLMTFLLALDQGTTSSRAIVFDRAGEIRALAQRETTQLFPQPGWVEQDPREIWRTQLECAQQALAEAGARAEDVAGIGITNQRETTVVWDRETGEPLFNAIVWQDRRTAAICERLKSEGLQPLFQGRTGLVLDAYFSGTKLRWILDHVDGA